MYWFWEFATKPLLESLEPDVMVEIGAWTGRTTEKLIAFSHTRQAQLHVIDPAPRFDVDGFYERFPHTMVFHRGVSHDVLPALPPTDAALIDGDHNWFTVYNELRLLDRHNRRYPVVLLHDVSWPYARRDMYYAPERIPDEFRQPMAQSGLRPGRSELDPSGQNSHLHHAATEGGPRNGVLTAIEDFMAEASEPLQLMRIPGSHGLGILMPDRLLETREKVRVQWEWLRSPEFLSEHCDRLETSLRVRSNNAFNLQRDLRSAHSQLRKLERQLEATTSARAT